MVNSWGNMFDYLTWRGDISFAQSGFNIIDGLILSTIAYINFPHFEEERISMLSAVKSLDNVPKEDRFRGLGLIEEKTLELALEASKCLRFKNLQIVEMEDDFSVEIQEQFAAFAFILPGDCVLISYRGTDSSLIGWKEDFNMAFINGTPAQKSSAWFTKKVIEKYDLPVRVMGHSKGGNLAVWGVSNLPEELQDKVLGVYNYDGPGFLDEFLESNGFKNIQDKIFSFVPESSVVGVLMGACDYLTIKTTTKSLLQHDPFSWKVAGKRFDYDSERSRSGRVIEKKINGMIHSLSDAEKEVFVEKIYDTLKTEDVEYVKDFEHNKVHHIFVTLPKIIKDIIDMKSN